MRNVSCRDLLTLLLMSFQPTAWYRAISWTLGPTAVICVLQGPTYITVGVSVLFQPTAWHRAFLLNTATNQCEMCPVGTYITVGVSVLFQPTARHRAFSWTLQPTSVKCVQLGPTLQLMSLFCFSQLRDTGPFPEHCNQPVWNVSDGDLHYSWCRCFVSANCTTLGRFLNTATNQCEMCPVGTYNSQWWVESCTDCPSGFTTKTTGMATSTRCYRTWDHFWRQQFLNLSLS